MLYTWHTVSQFSFVCALRVWLGGRRAGLVGLFVLSTGSTPPSNQQCRSVGSDWLYMLDVSANEDVIITILREFRLLRVTLFLL